METLNSLSLENKEFYDKTLLKRLLPTLVYFNYGQKRSLPKNSGKIITFRKYNSLAPVNSPLTEGVTPAGNSLSVSEIQATVEQYGDYIEISDVLDLVGIDPVLTETAELLGEQAGETIDNLIRDKISNGTNVRYVGEYATSTDTVSGVMTSGEIMKAVRTLKNDNAKPFDGKYYIGIIDPDISYDLQRDPLFLDVSKYNGGTQIIDGEIGKLGKVRFVETTNTKVEMNQSGNYVHSCFIIGKDAYGIVDIEGSAKPEMIIKPHGSSGTSDPLNQRATSGWKVMFTAQRLNELAMIRIECLTSTEMENNYTPSQDDIGGLGGDDEEEVITIQTECVTVADTSIDQCGEIAVNGTDIMVTGTILKNPETELVTFDGTHTIALAFANSLVSDPTNIRYTINSGDAQTTSSATVHVYFTTDSQKASQTVSIAWDGINYTTYTVDFSGATLEE